MRTRKERLKERGNLVTWYLWRRRRLKRQWIAHYVDLWEETKRETRATS